jgi:hypothetical protein
MLFQHTTPSSIQASLALLCLLFSLFLLASTLSTLPLCLSSLLTLQLLVMCCYYLDFWYFWFLLVPLLIIFIAAGCCCYRRYYVVQIPDPKTGAPMSVVVEVPDGVVLEAAPPVYEVV